MLYQVLFLQFVFFHVSKLWLQGWPPGFSHFNLGLDSTSRRGIGHVQRCSQTKIWWFRTGLVWDEIRADRWLEWTEMSSGCSQGSSYKAMWMVTVSQQLGVAVKHNSDKSREIQWTMYGVWCTTGVIWCTITLVYIIAFILPIILDWCSSRPCEVRFPGIFARDGHAWVESYQGGQLRPEKWVNGH